MSMEEFDAKCGEIAELVNHLHAGEYRLIELLGEVDKTMRLSAPSSTPAYTNSRTLYSTC